MNSYVILAIVVILISVIFMIYNGLIAKKNKVEYAFSSIDVMLKKRYDLIPNLVKTVKQYAKHEEKLLTDIVQLRNETMGNNLSNKERFEAEGKLSGLLNRMKIVVENYPDLKANENFLQLQAALNEIEEQISAARRTFNAAVMEYNNGVEMFPSNILAKAMNLQRKDSFQIAEAEAKNVDVGNLF